MLQYHLTSTRGGVQTPHLIASVAFGVEGHLKMTIKYSFLVVGVRELNRITPTMNLGQLLLCDDKFKIW